MSTLFLKNFVTFLLRPRMPTLQPAFAEATACQAEVLIADRPTPSAFVPQSRDYGVIDFTDHADGIRRLVSFAEAPGAREASKPVQLTPRADFLKRLPGSHSFELQHLGLAILPSRSSTETAVKFQFETRSSRQSPNTRIGRLRSRLQLERVHIRPS